MEYFVNKGAKLKCPWGSEQSELEVVHIGNPVFLCGKLMANIADNKPAVNIKPFGKCSSLANPVVATATSANYGRLQKMPCIPNIPFPWLNGKMNLIIKGSQALLSTSKCTCVWAATIEVADPGQSTVREDGPMNITITEPTQETQQALGRGFQPEQGTVGIATQGAMASGFQSSQQPSTSSQGQPSSSSSALQSSSSQASQSSSSVAVTLVLEVKGPANANPGQNVEYEISRYNKDRRSVGNGDKNRIRWAVIFNNIFKELDDEEGKERIVVNIEEEWAGNDIFVLACIEEFNPNVYHRTEVRKIPPVGFMPENFATMDEAGKFAIHYINQRSIEMNKEFGGRIYELKGRFYITFPKEGHEGYTGTLPESYLGGKLVAWYHTHGKSYQKIHQEFSAHDIAVSDEYRIVAYLGTTINKDAVQKYALNAPLVPPPKKRY